MRKICYFTDDGVMFKQYIAPIITVCTYILTICKITKQ